MENESAEFEFEVEEAEVEEVEEVEEAEDEVENYDGNYDENKAFKALVGVGLGAVGALAILAVKNNENKIKGLCSKIVCRKAEKLQARAEKLKKKADELDEESRVVEVKYENVEETE